MILRRTNWTHPLSREHIALIAWSALIVAFAVFVAIQPNQTVSQTSLSNENAIEHLKQTGELQSLGKAFTAARYEAERTDASAFATNHANHIRSTFSSSGLLLESNAKDARWKSHWRLQGLAYGNSELTVTDGAVRTIGNRVTIDHKISTADGSAIVEEWFTNTPDGLEHGFTLSGRLSDTAENLRLTIAIEGDLTAQADADGQNLKLLNKHKEAILNYEKLKVWDADGAEIPARMTTENGTLMLDVDDAAAKYPLTIDPTFSAAAKLLANAGAEGDLFGKSVAISGDTAIVGIPYREGGVLNQGAAYVFVRVANGLWVYQASLSANDAEANDHFGTSVAISGDTVVIGAIDDDIGANVNQGSAHVFVRVTNSIWSFQQKLTASDGADSDNFAKSVAVSGEYALIGTPGDNVGANSNQGSAYVFVRSGSSWTQQQKLTATQGELADEFGDSVAIAGSNAVVGAHGADTVAADNAGAAYVFTRVGTTWTQQERLWVNNGAEFDNFGSSVGISTVFGGFTTVIIGADGDDVNGSVDQGSAYVFTRSGDVWSFQQHLTAANGATEDAFGWSVAISGGTVIVGARYGRVGATEFQGAAYIFRRIFGTFWNERERLIAFDGEEADFFGDSVAISGDTAIVGAVQDDVANENQGSAHIFRLGSKPFDFDDDGKTDLAIFRPAPGEWWYLKSSDGGNAAFQFGASSDRIVPADFTGDSKTDAAVFRPSTGSWFVLRSEDFSFYSFPFGANGDLPAVGDFDGDGEADAAVFRPSTVTWYISLSNGGTHIQQFGANGDVPTAGDYDADGKADIAIYRPSLGQWWIQRSSNNSVVAFQFGSSIDKPVQGDYTGDGKADVALWRPSTGEWFILRSQDSSFYSFPFGTTGDTPAPGDYDGDGRHDATVFRPSNSTWFSQRTTAGTLIQQFGSAGDRPVPNAFVP